MTVPSPASIEEYRFLSIAMFLLRRLPRDAANLLDIACGYVQLPYRNGWNLIHRTGPGPGKSWMYLSADGSRVTFEDPGINPEDIQEIFFPFKVLDETSVWKWMTDYSHRHTRPEWAQEVLKSITRIDRSYDDPPTQSQLEATLKVALFELLIEGHGSEAQPEMIVNLLLRKYVALEGAGEPTSLVVAASVAGLASNSSHPLDRALQVRQQFVEFIDRLIEDRSHQPPRAFGLMTHVASLYGFIAMKLSMQIQSEFNPPKDVIRMLKRSDSYVDERLVSDVQTLTTEAASPSGRPVAGREDFDFNLGDTPEVDILQMLQQQYWPDLRVN